MTDDFPGAPRQLTPEQERTVVANLRAARERFERHGGATCMCGGLIYPMPDGSRRATCVHLGEPLTRAEIAAVVEGWKAADAVAPVVSNAKLATALAALTMAAASEDVPQRVRPDTRGVVGASGRANPAKKAERKRQRKARRKSR